MKKTYTLILLFFLIGCERDLCYCEPDIENHVLTEAIITLLDISKKPYEILNEDQIVKEHLGIFFDIETELQKPENPKCTCREAWQNFYTEYVIQVDVFFHDTETGVRHNVNDKVVYFNSLQRLSLEEFEALLRDPVERQFLTYNYFALAISDTSDLPDTVLIEIVTKTHLGNTFTAITKDPLQLLD